jgi:hypothetical protein
MFGIRKQLQQNSLLNDLRLFILVVGVVMIWRGIWNLLDHYFFPEYWVASSIGTIIIGVVILILNDNHLDALGVESE